MTFEEIKQQIFHYQAQGLKPFVSSSFQSHSIVLLHFISEIDKSIPVYFLNTGFHFPETLIYKKQITNLLGLLVIDLFPSVPKSQQFDNEGRLLFTSDPNYCCYLNKIAPLETVLAEMDVWISGVRASQSETRSQMKLEESAQYGSIRFHPMLDWTDAMIMSYIKKHQLPKHPLEDSGYISIGCEPCTRASNLDSADSARQSRWFGLNKTECGLHTELRK